MPAGQDVEAVQADPDLGVVGPLHDPPGPPVVVDVGPPGQRLEGEPDAVRAGQVAERDSWSADTSSESTDAVATLLQTSIVSMPSRFIRANLASARRRLPANTSSVTPSASRNGW